MNIFKKVFLLAFSTALFYNSYSQCLSDHYRDAFFKANPGIKAEVEKFDKNAQFFTSVYRATYTVPVVFHVIHTNGPENISKEQILDQLRVLNEDFSKTNANFANVRSIFTGVAANCEIEFVLAKIDPNGNCTDGINRVYSPLHVNARDNVKNIVRWDVNKYLNIWVVSSIDPLGQTGTVLGFANFPFMPASTDGVVIRADYVGTIGTAVASGAGRTLTHEVGHYLGLYHTFQDGCTGGDEVADTPPVASTFTNANCNITNSCANDNPNLPDMFENYMDYSRGECQAMFTIGQRNRMFAFLTTNARRISLVSYNTLVATGVEPNASSKPTAFFSSNKRIVCAGEPVQFYDESCKSNPTSRTWSFSGANIASSSDANPTITYATPGKYKVTLNVTNAAGTSSISVDEYITVRPSVAEIAPTYYESFETTPLVGGDDFFMSSLNPNVKWEITTAAARTGSKSLKIPISSTTNFGERFYIETPPINLAAMNGVTPILSFMTGYRLRNSENVELLRIYVSTDCGTTWKQEIQRGGAALSSIPSQMITNFVPTLPEHWRMVTFSLNDYKAFTNVMFRIEIESKSGNPVYIDDININQFYTSLEDQITFLPDVVIYPNPAIGQTTVLLTGNTDNGPIKVEIFDLYGKLIATVFEGNLTDSETEIHIDNTTYPSLVPGIYLVKISSGGNFTTKKLIFAQ